MLHAAAFSTHEACVGHILAKTSNHLGGTEMNPNHALKLSADVLRALYALREERITLDDLCEKVGANETPMRDGVRLRAPRREDVREIVRRLDQEGFVDA